MLISALPKTSTTDMEVTSIRLERDLKERLKGLSGDQGYQALVREVLWDYVLRHSGDFRSLISQEDIRASVPATARKEERCVLTGQVIRPEEPMLLGLTTDGDMVPLCITSF